MYKLKLLNRLLLNFVRLEKRCENNKKIFINKMC